MDSITMSLTMLVPCWYHMMVHFRSEPRRLSSQDASHALDTFGPTVDLTCCRVSLVFSPCQA